MEMLVSLYEYKCPLKSLYNIYTYMITAQFNALCYFFFWLLLYKSVLHKQEENPKSTKYDAQEQS